MDVQSYSKDSRQNKILLPLVLAVDDDEDNLELLTELLKLIECPFITAVDGQTTILMAQQHQPKLILLDMMLPDLDGSEVVRRLKQSPQTKEIPIVAVTAVVSAENQKCFLSAGCSDCVTKPYAIEELEAIVRSYLFTQDDS
ncbi:response regulator [Chroococcidiopsis sp. FACHB-1243]|uniref:response regulator n=1 Tax=Chroococcidiopsis sp. [FACHB-1243] TaxID=2692781 RepID=UPI00177E202F|nr:response regulator [Chroococcidiopsis sp. [FACHB-1243]]MBD2309355.1 response regulator [Chroococcidiopsis sp. [FACHB-1243]]